MNEMNLEEMRINKNGDYETLGELRDTHKPILIYGCANHAELVCDYLMQNGLSVEAFVVDSQYWKSNSYIKNIEVRKLENYIDMLDQYNIVIGFCNVDKSKFLISNSLMLKSRFYLFWEPMVVYEWDEKYIAENWEKLLQVYYGLEDELSKKIMKELIIAKLSRNGSGLLNFADNKQYFNELTYSIEPENEVYIDCGAYNGDTLIKYMAFTGGRYKKIYAFEPNEKNVSVLNNNIAQFPNVEIINKGTWNESSILEFEENGSASQVVKSKGATKIHTVTIDEVVGDGEVTFIKMDVEGSELESLQGAVKAIGRNMPKLAICCYHKQNDIIDLYNYVNGFNNGQVKYKFYLRHHSNSAYETVLYAIPVKIKK